VVDGWRLDLKDLTLLEEACRLRDTAGAAGCSGVSIGRACS
jgi:hypothetical protein